LFDTDDAMIRLDMSEFMEKHSVARLIGAPPGYVGYEEGGYLTERVRRKPYSVLLLDEVEKAHTDVFNILLQVLEDGRLTDGQGRTVDFRNTLIIMTSNLGSDVIQECIDQSSYVEMKRRVIDVVASYFRPEFINRIDDSVVFRNLGVEEIRKITTLQIDDLRQRLGIQGVELNVSESALEFLGNAGFDPVYGARPLRRVIQQRLENPLARRVLAGDLGTANEVYVDRDQQGLTIVACKGPQQNGNAVLSARKAS
jgi:ATP-dependent Clp protease ATP-binding subunit ClpB